MLQQLIDNMHVPDNILENLKDDDKHLIFNLIRKEQIRRFNVWMQSLGDEEEKNHRPNKRGKNVGFCSDDELVSFLGERPGDLPIEEKLKLEAQELAKQKALEMLNSSDNDVTETIVEENVEEKNYVDKSDETVPKVPPPIATKPKYRPSRSPVNDEDIKRKSVEIYHDLLESQKSLQEQAEEERRVTQIEFEKIQERNRLIDEEKAKLAENARKRIDDIAQESIFQQEEEESDELLEEEKNTNEDSMTKQDEQEVEVTAPEDSGARSSTSKQITLPEKKLAPVIPPRPSRLYKELIGQINVKLSQIIFKSKNDVKQWFLDNEWQTGRIFKSSENPDIESHNETPPDWFHGVISRPEAEALLRNKPPGTFLIRVSDRIPGYVLSYVVSRKCTNSDQSPTSIKHVLIEATATHYQFLGPSKCTYLYLADLITFFQKNKINQSTNEILTEPQGQDLSITNQNAPDYTDLLYGSCL